MAPPPAGPSVPDAHEVRLAQLSIPPNIKPSSNSWDFNGGLIGSNEILWDFYDGLMVLNGLYPLVMTNIAIENDH